MPTLILPFRPADFTLAGTLRAVNDANGTAQRIELAPQSIFSGDAEFDTTQAISGTSIGSFTVDNTANENAVDANTTFKSKLYISNTATSAYYAAAKSDAPLVRQTKSGNFDIYALVSGAGGTVNPSGGSPSLVAQSTNTATSSVAINVEIRSDSLMGATIRGGSIWFSTVSGTTTNAFNTLDKFMLIGGPVYLRLSRVANLFTGYISHTGFSWVSVGSATRADFTADQKLGFAVFSEAASNTSAGTCDFLRNWPPYDTTSPTASVVIDSGSIGTSWGMASFIGLENPGPIPQSGFGTVRYQYGASDTNPPTLNGSDLTLASMQAQSNPTGRYFKLQAKFTATNGYEHTTFAGGSIQATIGAAPTYSSY